MAHDPRIHSVDPYQTDKRVRNEAVKYIERLHRAGYHYCDLYPYKFGTRPNGEMVIMGFSEVTPISPDSTCKSGNPDKCSSFQSNRDDILGGDAK